VLMVSWGLRRFCWAGSGKAAARAAIKARAGFILLMG
jgi:hypothetical protein